MLVSTARLGLVLFATIALVNGGRRFIGERRRYYQVQKSTSFRTKYMNLESQLDVCLGKFLCGVRTVDNQCRLECIDEGNVCDGKIDCNDGRDEFNCPGPVETTGLTTCPDQPCPEETPCPTNECPEETPCPSSECPTGEIRCGDGSACKAIQAICDGTDQCPPGDTVDNTTLQCIMGNCPADGSPACTDEALPFSAVILAESDVSQSTCRVLCNIIEDCISYSLGDGMFDGTCVLFKTYPVVRGVSCDDPAVTNRIYDCAL